MSDESFSTGKHTWEIVLDNLAKGLLLHSSLCFFSSATGLLGSGMFIGVATASASLINYIGGDMFGYSIFCRDGRRFFQNKPLEPQESVFKQVPWKPKDVAKFMLDCDEGTLTVWKNKVLLGIAFEFLPKNRPLYPAVSFTNPGDVCTIQPENAPAKKRFL